MKLRINTTVNTKLTTVTTAFGAYIIFLVVVTDRERRQTVKPRPQSTDIADSMRLVGVARWVEIRTIFSLKMSQKISISCVKMASAVTETQRHVTG